MPGHEVPVQRVSPDGRRAPRVDATDLVGRRLHTMRRVGIILVLCSLSAVPVVCGLPFFERWTGEDVVTRGVNAPADAVWRRVRERVATLGLVVEAVRAEDRTLQLGWITPPGDGRLYLRCREGAMVGSASLRPRIRVRRHDRRTSVVIGAETRSTGGRPCVSTGQFEDWLADRLEPAMVAAERDAAANRTSSTPAPDR